MTLTTLSFSGVMITTAAAVAVNEGVGVFTAFAAVGASAGVFYTFLTNKPEASRRIAKAKFIVGGVSGVCLPRIGVSLWDWLAQWLTDPLQIIFSAFVCAWFGGTILHAAFGKLNARSDAIGEMVADAAEQAARLKLDKKND